MFSGAIVCECATVELFISVSFELYVRACVFTSIARLAFSISNEDKRHECSSSAAVLGQQRAEEQPCVGVNEQRKSRERAEDERRKSRGLEQQC